MLSKDTLYRKMSEAEGVSYVTGVCVFELTEKSLDTPPFPPNLVLLVMSSTDPRGMEALYGVDLEGDPSGELFSIQEYDILNGRRTGTQWIFHRMTAADLYTSKEPPVGLEGPTLTDVDVQSLVSEAFVMDDFEEWLAFKDKQPGLRRIN